MRNPNQGRAIGALGLLAGLLNIAYFLGPPKGSPDSTTGAVMLVAICLLAAVIVGAACKYLRSSK